VFHVKHPWAGAGYEIHTFPGAGRAYLSPVWERGPRAGAAPYPILARRRASPLPLGDPQGEGWGAGAKMMGHANCRSAETAELGFSRLAAGNFAERLERIGIDALGTSHGEL
jgi:hypothetical protein